MLDNKLNINLVNDRLRFDGLDDSETASRGIKHHNMVTTFFIKIYESITADKKIIDITDVNNKVYHVNIDSFRKSYPLNQGGFTHKILNLEETVKAIERHQIFARLNQELEKDNPDINYLNEQLDIMQSHSDPNNPDWKCSSEGIITSFHFSLLQPAIEKLPVTKDLIKFLNRFDNSWFLDTNNDTKETALLTALKQQKAKDLLPVFLEKDIVQQIKCIHNPNITTNPHDWTDSLVDQLDDAQFIKLAEKFPQNEFDLLSEHGRNSPIHKLFNRVMESNLDELENIVNNQRHSWRYKDPNGNTLVHLALHKGYPEKQLLGMLGQMGSGSREFRAKNVAGQTLLDLAIANYSNNLNVLGAVFKKFPPNEQQNKIQLLPEEMQVKLKEVLNLP